MPEVKICKSERLMHLYLALSETRVPLSRAEIRGKVMGYPQDDSDTDSFARMLERDKADLRDMGYDAQLRAIPNSTPIEYGYIIDQPKMPDLNLTTHELLALYLAQVAVPLAGGAEETESAFRKLGGRPAVSDPDDLSASLLAELPNRPITRLLEAKLNDEVAEFSYGGEQRELLVWRLDYHNGKWSVTGHDLLRGAERSFMLSRIAGEVSARPAKVAEKRHRLPPRNFDPNQLGIRSKPWEVEYEAALETELLVDAGQAGVAKLKLGADAVIERRDDGSVVFRLQVGSRLEFYNYVLFFMEEAEILSPPELRQGFVEHLRELAA